jgi:hypothetical protein
MRSIPRTDRIWIEILALGTAIACAIALLIAALSTASGVALGALAPPQASATSTTSGARTYEGMVTCSRCGARHSADFGKTAADCARICVRGGAAFALIDGDRTYVLDGDLAELKRFAGRRARIIGIANGKTIKVSSIAAA